MLNLVLFYSKNFSFAASLISSNKFENNWHETV